MNAKRRGQPPAPAALRIPLQIQPETPPPMVDQPAIPMHETPEFREAVAKAAAEAVAKAMADAMTLQAAERLAAPVPVGAHVAADGSHALDPNGVLNGLAMAIATLTDQGGERKKLSPDEIAKRERGKARMERLILEARAVGVVGRYELADKVYLDGAIIEPLWLDSATKQARRTVIDWDGVPSTSFVPMNDPARAIMAAFLESIGDNMMDAAARDAYRRDDPYITAKGVVINGRAPARAQAPESQPHARIVRDDTGASYKPVNILGTIAEPALQTV